MLVEDCFWSLYNTKEQVRIDGLRTIQIQGMLTCLCLTGFSDYMVWQEGTDDWVSAESVYEVIKEATGLFSVPPLPPEFEADKPDAFVSAPAEADRPILNRIANLAPSTKGGQKFADVRMSPRFLIAFKVFITYGGRVFKNETLNISVGGMKLKTPLENYIEGSIGLVLMHEGKELNMQCKVLKDDGNGSPKGATRLFIEKCNRMDILRAWILHGNHKMAE